MKGGEGLQKITKITEVKLQQLCVHWFRYIEPEVPLDSENIQEDKLYIEMMQKLKKYEEKVKKVAQ